MQSQPILVRNWRCIIALIVGLPCIVLMTGVFYSLSGIRGGGYGETIFLAIVYGLSLWLVFRLGRCERMPKIFAWLALAFVCLGPVVIGHFIGYGNLRSFAYRLVQEDSSGSYSTAWKSLKKEELFPKWVGSVTGTEIGGIQGYFCVQAAIGWEGWEGPLQTLCRANGHMDLDCMDHSRDPFYRLRNPCISRCDKRIPDPKEK